MKYFWIRQNGADTTGSATMFWLLFISPQKLPYLGGSNVGGGGAVGDTTFTQCSGKNFLLLSPSVYFLHFFLPSVFCCVMFSYGTFLDPDPHNNRCGSETLVVTKV